MRFQQHGVLSPRRIALTPVILENSFIPPAASNVVLNKLREEKIHNWVVGKIKATYVRLNDNYRDCDFEYQGWIR